jgi:AGZA family xanthine/uracil permease-like MFS transporter
MFMIQPVIKNDWLNYSERAPKFLTLIMMPCTYSISDGILIGCISYVIFYALAGKGKQIGSTMWVLAVLFVLRYIFL